MAIKLNLPEYEVKYRMDGEQQQVFDPIRKKYVALTPEEYVRQHVVNYLVNHRGFPKGLLAIESPVTVNNMTQRADIIAFSRNGKPLLVVECKAYTVEIMQQTFTQAARYNLYLRAPYLMVTNGIVHYCSKINFALGNSAAIVELPEYNKIESD
jgi:predicted type IV restriction endonuclease